jgi:hypothetical protein
VTITQHGSKKNPFFKGVSAFNNARGRPLVFFGWSRPHVRIKEAEYLEQHHAVSEPRPQTKPYLRLVTSN